MSSNIDFKSQLSSAITHSLQRRNSMLQVETTAKTSNSAALPTLKRHSICGPLESNQENPPITAIHTQFEQIENLLRALPKSNDLTLAQISIKILKTKLNGETDKALVNASKALFLTDLTNVELTAGTQIKLRELVNAFIEQQQKDLATLANRSESLNSSVTIIE